MTASEIDPGTPAAILTFGIAIAVLIVAAALGWAARRNRRPLADPDPFALERNTHDWNCDVGMWPHEGNCWPAPERGFVAVMRLAECEQRGLGNSIRVPEDDYCGGAGE